MERFYQKIGFNMAFIETIPIGIVPVEYSVSKNSIKIDMDFTHIKKDGLKRIFVTNEQGSKFFPRYLESDGQVIFGRHISARKITADY